MLPPVLINLIPSEHLSPEQQDAVACALAAYCLKLSPNAYARRAPASILKAAKSEMMRNFDAEVRLKLTIYRIAISGARDPRASFVEHGLHPDDVWVWDSLERWGLMPALQALVFENDLDLTNTPHPNQIDRDCQRWLRETNTDVYVRQLAGATLHFIVKGNRMKPADMHQELLERAVMCYYRAIPLYSGLHLLNHVKCSVKNRSKYLISFYTAEMRSRMMVNPEGGYMNRVRTIETGGENDVAAVDPEVEAMATFHGIPGSPVPPDHEIRTMYTSVRQLMERYRRCGKLLRQRALNLLILSPDAEFVAYCNRQRRRRAPLRSTAEAFAACGSAEEFYSIVRSYLDMPIGAFDGLLRDLRSARS